MNDGARRPRKISAVFAALSLVMPFFVLLLGVPVRAEGLLPTCCRRGGQHHCMMRMMEDGAKDSVTSSSSPRVVRLFEKCPYMPGSIPSASNALVWRPTQGLASALVKNCGAVIQRGRYAREVPQDSAHFKRGPPCLHISA